MIIIDLVFNLALLVSVSVLSGFIDRRWRRKTTTGVILQGLLFGLVAHLGMAHPYVLSPGIIFDGRSVVLSLCSLYFGPVSGLIAACIALIYRIGLGGPGLTMGVSVIILSTLIGILFHFHVRKGRFKPSTLFLYIFGFIVNFGMVLLIFAIPSPMRLITFKTVTLTILGIYPVATALIGKILKDQADSIDRRKAEENLLKSEALYQDLYENAPDMYLSIDPNTRKIIKCNQTLINMTGYDKTELIGRPVFELYHPDSLETAKNALQHFLSAGILNDIELKVMTKGGILLFVNLNVTAIRDDTGNIVSTRSSWRDITRQKHAEDELRQMNVTLEKRVAERTSELEKINLELLSKNKELEQFTYLTTHDLREPIRTLSGFTELLHQEYAGKLSEDANKYVKFIHDAAVRMQLMINGLLEYTFLGKVSTLAIIDFNQVVSEVIADMGDAIEESNTVISVLTLPVIHCNATEIRLLFQNLVENAIKFRKKTTQPVIRISAEKRGNEWLFSVEDNGIGIEEKNREKVFVIYKRLHNRDEYKGTGIGLAHCKKIVELHGGKIWVEANTEGGSTFRFTIPVS